MSGFLTIELKGLRFRAFHGVLEEEGLLGNDFEVELLVHYQAPENRITSIKDTINYVDIYGIVKEEMNVRSALLETVVMKICHRLHVDYPQIEKITITLSKLTPPIHNFTGTVGVTYTKAYN